MQKIETNLHFLKLDHYLDNMIIGVTLSALFFIPLLFSYFDITAVFNDLKIFTLHLAAILITIFWLWKILLTRLNTSPSSNNNNQWDLMKWAGRNPARWGLFGASIWIFAQVGATLLSPLPVISFFGGDESRSGYNLYDSLSLMVIFFAIAFRFRSIQNLKLLVYTLAITGTITAAYGVAQHFGWDPIGGNLALRVQASFGNTLNFGGYMVMAIPATIALIHMKRTDNMASSAIIALALSLQLAGIWFSGGRGPFVAAFASITTAFILTMFIGSNKATFKFLIFLLIAIVIAAIVVALPSPKGDLGLDRFVGIAKELEPPTTTSTNIEGGLAGRFSIWGSSIKLATQWPVPLEEPNLHRVLRPIFGLGPDMYVYSYPLVAQPSSWLRLVDHTHNYELQILMEQGFLGLIGFMALTGSLTICTVLIIKKHRKTKGNSDHAKIVILAILPAFIGKMFELQTGVARASDLAMTIALFGAVIAIYEVVNRQINKTQPDPLIQQSFEPIKILPLRTSIKKITSVFAVVSITTLFVFVFVTWDIRRLSASLILSNGHNSIDLSARAKAWADAQDIAPERSSITFKLFEEYLRTAKEQYELGNTNEAMRLLMIGREMLLDYEKRDPLELDIQIGLSKTTSTLTEWGYFEYLDELTYRAQKLARIAPAYPTLLGTSATAMTSVGLHELAIEYAEKAIATEATTKPWSKAWYAKGRSLYELGQESEGIIALQTATQKQPGTEAALLSHKMLAEIYRKQGNLELSELHTVLGDADITVVD